MGTLERILFAFFRDFGSWTLQITRTAAASPCGLALCLCRSSSVLMSLHSFILWNRKLRLTDTGQLPAQGQWLGSFFFFFFLFDSHLFHVGTGRSSSIACWAVVFLSLSRLHLSSHCCAILCVQGAHSQACIAESPGQHWSREQGGTETCRC